jgi:nucleotide-binding universal stress UspA family protein
VPTGPGLSIERRLDAALHIARRTHAHIETLFIRPDPAALQEAFPVIATDIGAAAEEIEREGAAALSRACAEFEAWCRSRNVSRQPGSRLDATFASWREERGDLAKLVAMTGRMNDIIIVDGRTTPESFSATMLDAALFSSGRPTLVIGGHVPDDLLRHVVIAWNGSLEATRAVASSISLLHDAEQVSVFTSPAEPNEKLIADIRSYLHWHGIVAQPAPPSTEAVVSVGEALLATCKTLDATMLIMGAYTHSRIRELFLGGVTQHVLGHASLPVLMAH